MKIIEVPQVTIAKTPQDLMKFWREKANELWESPLNNNQTASSCLRQCADDLERFLAGKVVTP